MVAEKPAKKKDTNDKGSSSVKKKEVEPKYWCVFCEFTTNSLSRLRRHKKDVHGYPREAKKD